MIKCRENCVNVCALLDLHADDPTIANLDRCIESQEASMDGSLQHFANITQKIMDIVTATERRRFLRLVIGRMSKTKDICPEQLYLDGVTKISNEPLEFGGFGLVYQGHYRGEVVALKRLFIKSGPNAENARRLNKRLRHEILVWRNLEHPHILPYFGITENTSGLPSIVSPWMEHEDIRNLLQHDSFTKRDVTDRRECLLRWIDEVASGLAYLHEEGIIHGDLRGANILIDSDWSVRLADFGVAVFVVEEVVSQPFNSTRAGNPRWQAPELLAPAFEDDLTLKRPRPTAQSDIFAFACVVVEVFTSKNPYSNIPSDYTVAHKIVQGIRPLRPDTTTSEQVAVPDDLWLLAERCWDEQPMKRPSAVVVKVDTARIRSSPCQQ
ncbi:unnamed protein product [Somion occarium]|uniref:Protein kinase domain-containing protein n=1 Tax=Somion occarium TaxID=3059160 RepID=A0ABP1E688_9APHY